MYRHNERAVQQNIVSRRSKDHHRSVSQSMGPEGQPISKIQFCELITGLRSHKRYAIALKLYVYICVCTETGF
jgi:hypothetical protein